MIRVAIADDQGLIRAGFRSLLEAEPDIEIVGEAGTGTEIVAVAKIQRFAAVAQAAMTLKWSTQPTPSTATSPASPSTR